MTKLNVPARIRIEVHPEGHKRFYKSTFPFAKSVGHGYGYVPSREVLENDYGVKGADLYLALVELAPVGFDIYRNQVTIQKSGAYRWSEIEPLVLQILRDVYGEFKLERESLWRRMLYGIRRNFTGIMFPHWYK